MQIECTSTRFTRFTIIADVKIRSRPPLREGRPRVSSEKTNHGSHPRPTTARQMSRHVLL